MEPFFSVIIPCYKINESLIERAIESVKMQKEKNWELILIDDNGKVSDWVTINENLQKKYTSKKIKFIFHEKNMGANKARNNGIKVAKGEFIAFLDADDEWDVDYLSSVSDHIKNKQAVFTYCNYKIVNKAGIQPPRYKSNHSKNGYIFDEEVYGDLISPTSAVTVKKEVILKAGLFDESLLARQDYDMWLRICENNKVNFILEPYVAIYRDGHESISSNHKRHIEGTEVVLNKILKNPKVSNGQKPAIKSSHYNYLALTCMRYYDYHGARKYAKLSWNSIVGLKAGFLYIISYLPKIFEGARKARKLYLYKTNN